MKLKYHKFSLLYKEMKIWIYFLQRIVPYSELVSFESIIFHYIVTFPQASGFVKYAFFSEKIERWLL